MKVKNHFSINFNLIYSITNIYVIFFSSQVEHKIFFTSQVGEIQIMSCFNWNCLKRI